MHNIFDINIHLINYNNILQGILLRKDSDKIILVNNLPSQESFNKNDLDCISQSSDLINSFVSAEEQRNEELQVL